MHKVIVALTAGILGMTGLSSGLQTFGDPNVMVARPSAASINTSERHRVIEGAVEILRKYYFDREVAQKTAEVLLTHEKNGEYGSITDGEAFADLVTKQMRDASHDMHLEVDFSQDTLPDGPPPETAQDVARHRQRVEQNHCFVRKAEILPQNLGYLKLDWFSETVLCRTTISAALAAVNNANSVIFDLRDNRGGFPDMVMFIAGYLFDHPEYIYSPREAPSEQSWTSSPVPGNKLAGKPVYILTSASTFSGAEQFCYDMKMLKRATLVGETTGGGAHAGVYHRIDDHFSMGVPEQKAINPFGVTDWEGVGVEPDVRVKAAVALETAEMLAKRKLQPKE